MLEWILIVTLTSGGGTTTGFAIDHVEFATKASCEKAAAEFRERNRPHANAFCVERPQRDRV